MYDASSITFLTIKSLKTISHQMGCALLGLSAAGSGFLGAHMTASIGGADMPVVSESSLPTS